MSLMKRKMKERSDIMKTVKIILLSVLCYAVSYIVGAAVGEYFGELIENVIVED